MNSLVTESENALHIIKNALLSGGRSIVFALIVLIVGWWIVNLLSSFLKSALIRSRIDESSTGFINSIAKYLMRILLFVIVISKLGVDMTSVVAILTSAALAVGLALQGSLSNIAGGLLILVMKPFKVGDYIDDGTGHEGIVLSIEMMYTRLQTVDNRVIWIPNGTLANSSITNLTSQSTRKIDFETGIAYDEDIDNVRQVLLSTASASSHVLDETPPEVFVKEFQKSSVLIVLRVSVSSNDYWPARRALQEEIKKAFDKNGISIPYEHLSIDISGDRMP